MKSLESPSLTMHNVTIVTRLRSPNISTNKKPQKKNSKDKPTSKSSNKTTYQKNYYLNKNKYSRINDSKSQKKQTNPYYTSSKKGLTETLLYTMFTSYQQSNLMLVSSKPIEGSTINQAFQTQNDLYDFGKNFLKESALFEFDKIYNESNSIDIIYKDLIKDNISNLFQKKNSCILFYGPIDSGKSFLLRGGATHYGGESGLLYRGIRDIFRLISLYNQANTNTSSFHVKFCSYQIYLDNIHDLLSNDNYNITIKKYLEKNYVNTNLVGLNEKEIKNLAEYESCMREAVHNRATLSQKLKINDFNRKSYFIISIRLEKKIYSKDGILIIDDNFKNYSCIDFVELVSSNYANNSDTIPENDTSPKALLYRNTDNVFNSLCENILCSCNCTTPQSDCALTLALKNSINPDSNIVFINCVIPWESPPNYSYKAIKFTNWLRNMVLEQNQNVDNKNQESQNDKNNYNMNSNEIVNINLNSNNNSNSNLVNDSNERLPSIQRRNNAYGNTNFENQKKNLNVINKTDYIERNKNNKYYNVNTYQNKINDKNNGLDKNILKNDFEEQPGNLTMLNSNHPELINMSSNTTVSDIYKNQRFSNDNKMNTSVNLPNSDKVNINLKNSLHNKQRNNNNNILKRNNNNNALYIKDNTEEEIKSIKERIRKKYKSPPKQNNINNNNINIFNNNNLNKQNLSEIKPYEHIPSYQIRSENQRNINLNTNNIIGYTNNMNRSNNDFNDSRMTNPQEIKIKELENKVKFLEEKSFENTQRLEEIRINKETISNNNNNLNATINTNNNNNNMNYGNNNVTISYLPDAEVEKIKQEQATLKSDNIIFREDINRLTDLNQHLENELIEQRNRNIELANENEQLSQEKSKIEKELKTALETIDKIKLKETSLEQYYNERLMLQNKMRENENDLKKTLEEKNKYEIDFKVLQARFNELQIKHEKINEEYNNNKKKHDEEIIKIDEKIDVLTKEIEKLQKENNNLRLDNEKKVNDINSISLQRDNFKEKFEEEKRKNEMLCEKIGEIENEFRMLQNDKNKEMMNKYKMEENKKNRYETKTKIINELQTRIQNYKNQRLMMKNNEEDDY
mgnify:CR=1 FL=1